MGQAPVSLVSASGSLVSGPSWVPLLGLISNLPASGEFQSDTFHARPEPKERGVRLKSSSSVGH